MSSVPGLETDGKGKIKLASPFEEDPAKLRTFPRGLSFALNIRRSQEFDKKLQ